MTKKNVTICIEVETYNALKKSGLNASEAAEKGILAALGVLPPAQHEVSPAAARFEAIDAEDRRMLREAKATGRYKNPGYFGRTTKCPEPEKWLHGLMRTKYRAGDLTKQEIADVMALVVQEGPVIA